MPISNQQSIWSSVEISGFNVNIVSSDFVLFRSSVHSLLIRGSLLFCCSTLEWSLTFTLTLDSYFRPSMTFTQWSWLLLLILQALLTLTSGYRTAKSACPKPIALCMLSIWHIMCGWPIHWFSKSPTSLLVLLKYTQKASAIGCFRYSTFLVLLAWFVLWMPFFTSFSPVTHYSFRSREHEATLAEHGRTALFTGKLTLQVLQPADFSWTSLILWNSYIIYIYIHTYCVLFDSWLWEHDVVAHFVPVHHFEYT